MVNPKWTPAEINQAEDTVFKHYFYAQMRFNLTTHEQNDIKAHFQIPSLYNMLLFTAKERIYHRPDGLWIFFNPNITIQCQVLTTLLFEGFSNYLCAAYPNWYPILSYTLSHYSLSTSHSEDLNFLLPKNS